MALYPKPWPFRPFGLEKESLRTLLALRSRGSAREDKAFVYRAVWLHTLREKGYAKHDAFGVWRCTKKGASLVGGPC